MGGMSEPSCSDRKLALNRIYTKRGDGGETSLLNGWRVRKHDVKIEAYGTVDEWNSLVGVAQVCAAEGGLERIATIHPVAVSNRR